MKKRIKRWHWVLFVFLFVFSFSGCGLEKDVAVTLDAFFDDVTSGRYAQNDYSSDYATDDSTFSALEIKDDRIWPYIHEGLKNIQYRIDSVDGKRSDETVSCKLILDVIDVASVYATVELRGYDEDSLFEAMFRPLAPRTEMEVVLDLKRIDQSDEWVIQNASAITDAFVAPYLEMSLPFDQSPEEAYDIHFEWMRTDLIESEQSGFELSEYEEAEREFFIAYIESLDYEVLSVYIEGTKAEIEVELAIHSTEFYRECLYDQDLLYDLYREIILMAHDRQIMTEDQISSIVLNMVTQRINRGNITMTSHVYDVTMTYHVEDKTWYVINEEFGESFFEEQVEEIEAIDPFEDEGYEDILEDVMIKVIEDLLDEGVLSRTDIINAANFIDALE